jgi:hypothetical protein
VLLRASLDHRPRFSLSEGETPSPFFSPSSHLSFPSREEREEKIRKLTCFVFGMVSRLNASVGPSRPAPSFFAAPAATKEDPEEAEEEEEGVEQEEEEEEEYDDLGEEGEGEYSEGEGDGEYDEDEEEYDEDGEE